MPVKLATINGVADRVEGRSSFVKDLVLDAQGVLVHSVESSCRH